MALAFAQVKDGNTAGGVSLTVTFDAGIAAGSIILAVGHYQVTGGFPIVSVVDGSSDTVTDSGFGDLYDGNSLVSFAKAFFNATTGVTTVTITLTGAAHVRMVIYEVTGFDAGTGSWDQTAHATSTSAANSGTTAALAQANEVAIGYSTNYDVFTAMGSGFTADGGNDTTFFDAIAGHQVLSSAAGIACTATANSYPLTNTIVATVKGTVTAATFTGYVFSVGQSSNPPTTRMVGY